MYLLSRLRVRDQAHHQHTSRWFSQVHAELVTMLRASNRNGSSKATPGQSSRCSCWTMRRTMSCLVVRCLLGDVPCRSYRRCMAIADVAHTVLIFSVLHVIRPTTRCSIQTGAPEIPFQSILRTLRHDQLHRPCRVCRHRSGVIVPLETKYTIMKHRKTFALPGRPACAHLGLRQRIRCTSAGVGRL